MILNSLIYKLYLFFYKQYYHYHQLPQYYLDFVVIYNNPIKFIENHNFFINGRHEVNKNVFDQYPP